MRRDAPIGGRRPRRLRLLDVAVLSVPLLVGLGYAAIATILDFRTALQFDDWWSQRQRLETQLAGRLAAAVRLPAAMAERQRMDAEAHDPWVIRVGVAGDAWDDSVADPFLGDPGWVDATVLRQGGLQEAEVRRRGDTSVHWITPKVSFTLQVPRGEHVRGFRELALTGKEVLSADLANAVPAELGVTAPFSAVVPVYLNDRFYGLFRAAEPIDESFLRRVGWMPGNVFRAEAAERGEYYKNVPRNVWVNPYIWDRVAENDVAGVDTFRALHELLEAVNGTTLEDHRRLMSLIDRGALAGLLAATLVVGDPYHMSGVHNQFWFEDPATGTLHAIPWDLRLLDLESPPAPGALNDFFRAALRDPFLVDEVLQRAHRAIEGGLYERLERRVRTTETRFAPYLAYERLRRELVSDPGRPDEILARLRGNLETLRRRIADARFRYAAARDGRGVVLDLESAGYAGADLVGLRVPGDPGEDARLRLDRNRNGRPDPADPEVAVRVERGADGTAALRLAEPVELLPAWNTEPPGFRAGRLHYRLFLEGRRASSLAVEGIEPELRNRITDGPVGLETAAPATPLGAADAWSPWRFEDSPGRAVRLAGEVRLSETLSLGERDRLIVEPGTTVRLDPDVSIVSRGPVTARGTPARPIRFVPALPGEPWGALALLGPGADGSAFDHVSFVGGGGALVGRVELKGMVSVHRAGSVRLRDVTFQDNMRSDDAFNAVHSDVTIERCVFRRANADAIDFDHSTGAIVGCLFEDSGNDAIDLMTSGPLIASNRMVRSGDKGISVGEESHPRIVDNHIVDGVRGIEVKDRSRPVILHNTIERNEVGLLLQVKNWRYAGGGWARVLYSRITGNERDLDVDPESFFSLYESQVGESPIEPAPGPRPRWIHAAHGVEPSAPRPGALGSAWRARPPLDPAWDATFPRTFHEDAAPWIGEAGIELRRRDGALVAWIERDRAPIARPVDWELRAGARHELVLELTTRDLESLRLRLASEDGEVTRDLRVGTRSREIAQITVELPPGRYRRLALEAAPRPGAGEVDPRTGLVERRGGRVSLHRIRLFSYAAAGEGTVAGTGEDPEARAAIGAVPETGRSPGEGP